MNCLRFFLPAVFALSAFGQSAQNAVDPTLVTKKVVKTILGASLGQGTLPVVYLERFTGAVKETSCSAPLIEMEIPKGLDFVISQVPPLDGFSDNMPVVRGLPVCAAGR